MDVPEPRAPTEEPRAERVRLFPNQASLTAFTMLEEVPLTFDFITFLVSAVQESSLLTPGPFPHRVSHGNGTQI